MNIPRSINFYTRILFVWISTLTSGGATDEKDAAPIMIEMWSQNSGWRLLVYADGSGSLGYGSTAGDVAVFPKGAVDFKSLVDSARQKEVVKLKKPEGAQILDPETWRFRSGPRKDCRRVPSSRQWAPNGRLFVERFSPSLSR
jgi:hypothetical protein